MTITMTRRPHATRLDPPPLRRRAGRRLRGQAAAGAGHRAGGAAAAARLRTPDAILADAVAATGGVAGWAAHKTAHIKLTISLQGMGMGGPAEHFQTNANQSLTLTTLPGVGAIREGSNGKVLWAQDPDQRHCASSKGPRPSRRASRPPGTPTCRRTSCSRRSRPPSIRPRGSSA